MIASMTATPALRQRIDFTQPYYQTPARFVTLKTFAGADATPATLSGKPVGAVAGSAHEAYLKTFFPGVIVKTYPDFTALHEALRAGEVSAIFADGLTLAVWLAGESSAELLRLQRRPVSSRAAFSARASASPCARKTRICGARWTGRSRRLAAKGVYAEIYRKYFPVGFF